MIIVVQTNTAVATDCPCILVCSGKVLDKLSAPSFYEVNEETYLQRQIYWTFLELAAAACLRVAEVVFLNVSSTSGIDRHL